MSLELIDEIITNWKDPNYKGIKLVTNSQYTRDDYAMNKTIKDIEEMKYIKSSVFKIGEYNNTVDGLTGFYQGYNFITSGEFSYLIKDDHMDYSLFNKYLKKNVKNVLEVGFNAGFISTHILSEINTEITSIDYYENVYTWYGKAFVDEKFPGKHNLLIGMPSEVIKTIFFGQNHAFKFDLMIINEDHDIYNMILDIKQYAHENTIIIINKVCPHKAYGIEPYIAINQLVKDQILIFKDHHKIGKDYINGIAVLKFNLNNETSIITPRSYKDMELGIPLNEFNEFVKNRQEDRFSDNSVVKIYLQKLLMSGVKVDKKIINYVKEKFNINI